MEGNAKKKAGRRILVFLSAPPGTGKTTLVQFLEYLSEQEADAEPIQAIGLDGFHYHRQYILTHEACVGGEDCSHEGGQRLSRDL